MKSTFVLMMLALAGCAAHYAKPGASTQEFNADFSQCIAQASQAASGSSGFTRTAIMIDNRDMCMAGKGWAKQ